MTTEPSGVDLARQALLAAREAARKNGATSKKPKRRTTTVVRRDGCEPLGLDTPLGRRTFTVSGSTGTPGVWFTDDQALAHCPDLHRTIGGAMQPPPGADAPVSGGTRGGTHPCRDAPVSGRARIERDGPGRRTARAVRSAGCRYPAFLRNTEVSGAVWVESTPAPAVKSAFSRPFQSAIGLPPWVRCWKRDGSPGAEPNW